MAADHDKDANQSGVGMLGEIARIAKAAAADVPADQIEVQLRLVARAANVGFWDWDLQTDEVFFSPEWKHQIGYRDEEIANRFEEWQSRVHPDDLEPTIGKVRSFIANPDGWYEAEFRFRHKDGSYRWIYALADVLRGADGTPTRILGCHIDVTERKRSEAELRGLNATLEQRVVERTNRLRESEELNRRTLHELPAHIAVIDREGRIVAVNRAWEDFAARNEAPGNPTVTVGASYLETCRRAAAYNDQSAAEALDGIEAVLSGRVAKFTIDYPCHSSKEQRWFSLTVLPLAPSGNGGAVITHLDITQQKIAVQEVRQSEALLRLLVQNTPAPVAMFDTQMRYLMASDRWLREFELHDRPYLRVSHYDLFPDLPDEWKEVHRRALRGEVLKSEGDPWMRSDGTRHWVRWEAHPWRTASGAIGGLVLFGEDITARRASEMVLRESEARLNAVITWAADGILTIAEDGIVLSANAAAVKIFGYAEAEMIGHNVSKLAAEPYRSAHDGYLKRYHETREPRIIGNLRKVEGQRKDGRTFPMELAVAKVPSEGPHLYVGIVRDVSERERAEAALRDSEERLRMAIEAGNIGIFAIDLVSGVVRDSAELSRMLGLSGGSDTHHVDDAIARVHRDDQARVRRHYDAALAPDGNGRLDIEFRFVRPASEVRWMAWSGRVRCGNGPEGRVPEQFFGTCVDITERKHAEEVLNNANVILEARVAERTRQLEQEMKLREQTQLALVRSQRLEALGQLTGGIAHDFNNLLTVVSGNLELAETKITDEQARRSVRKAIEAVEMGASLNRRLLTFARRRKLAAQRLVLNERMSEMQNLLRRTLGEEITLATKLDADLWPTLTDPGEIDSAVINLAINARDAMPNGGTLTLSTRNMSLEAAAAQMADAQPGDYICLALTDTGHGMTPEVLKRAIEPFFTTKGSGKGTGLGLSSVYGFARQSGGFVDISSEVGKGTTVQVCLPRAKDEVAGARRTSTEGKVPTGEGELILVVEDNEQVRQVTLARLESLGYDVLEAQSGPEAIEVLKSAAPVALVFSDVVMPGGMSGYDIARWVHKSKPGIKVLLTSGNEEPARREAPDLSTLSVLGKPYSRAQLGHAVHDALLA
jgi:PAS domain S-box-containing protein